MGFSGWTHPLLFSKLKTMTEKKSIKEWLEELPEEHRQKAIKNTNPNCFHIKQDSLSWALAAAFAWDISPEGHGYWMRVYAEISK